MQVFEFNACVAESMTKQEFSKELRERKKNSEKKNPLL